MSRGGRPINARQENHSSWKGSCTLHGAKKYQRIGDASCRQDVTEKSISETTKTKPSGEKCYPHVGGPRNARELEKGRHSGNIRQDDKKITRPGEDHTPRSIENQRRGIEKSIRRTTNRGEKCARRPSGPQDKKKSHALVSRNQEQRHGIWNQVTPNRTGDRECVGRGTAMVSVRGEAERRAGMAFSLWFGKPAVVRVPRYTGQEEAAGPGPTDRSYS